MALLTVDRDAVLVQLHQPPANGPVPAKPREAPMIVGFAERVTREDPKLVLGLLRLEEAFA